MQSSSRLHRACAASAFVLVFLVQSVAALGAQGATRHVSEKLVTTIDSRNWLAASLTVSPDSRRVAYVGFGKLMKTNVVGRSTLRHQFRKQVVIVDGKPGLQHDAVIKGTLAFSADSRHVAYAAQNGLRCFVVIDGKPQKSYPGIAEGALVFCPDGTRVAYVVKKRGAPGQVVVDGERESRPYDSIIGGTLVFSPDGKHLAYGARSAGWRYVVLDGVAQNTCDTVVNLVFSPDGRRLAYVARLSGGKWLVVVNGKTGTLYDTIGDKSLTFSADGSRVAYWAQKNGKWYVVLDGREIGPYDGASTIVFSPDGKKVRYAARFGNHASVVADGRKGPEYDRVGLGTLAFSPDGERFAYVASLHGKLFVVLDGKEGPRYDNIGRGGIAFSPNGRHVAYAAHSGGRQCVVVDGVEGTKYDAIVSTGGGKILFDSPDSLHYLVQKGAAIHLVEETLGAAPAKPPVAHAKRDLPENLSEAIHDEARIKLCLAARLTALPERFKKPLMGHAFRLFKKYQIDPSKTEVSSKFASVSASGGAHSATVTVQMKPNSVILDMKPVGRLPLVTLKGGSMTLHLPSMRVTFEEGAQCTVHEKAYRYTKGEWIPE